MIVPGRGANIIRRGPSCLFEKKVAHGRAAGPYLVFSSAQYRQVKFLTPEEVFSFIEGLVGTAADRREDGLQLRATDPLAVREDSIEPPRREV